MMPTFESNTLFCMYHQSISILCKDRNKGAPLFYVSTTIYIVVSSPPYFYVLFSCDFVQQKTMVA